MKERPILFSGHMPLAVREDRKTQTRRIVKLPKGAEIDAFHFDASRGWRMGVYVEGSGADVGGIKCPYGAPGDQLWVREEHFRFGHWERAGKTKTGREKWAFVADGNTPVQFDAPKSFLASRAKSSPEAPRWYKRLARFMPKWASRTTLEVTGVRVSRLSNITCGDAVAEGIESVPPAPGDFEAWRDYGATCNHGVRSPISSFASLWRSINGPESWAANPWVWCVSFKRVSP